MPVGGNVGVRPADVIDQQDLVGVFGFVGGDGHKWLKMIKKILKKCKKKCGSSPYIHIRGGVGGGPPLAAQAQRSEPAGGEGSMTRSLTAAGMVCQDARPIMRCFGRGLDSPRRCAFPYRRKPLLAHLWCVLTDKVCL